MAWVKIDDQFPDHPKIVTVGPIAAIIQVRAVCYASRYLTDGFIPKSALNGLLVGLDRIGIESPGAPGSFLRATEFDWPTLLVDTRVWTDQPGGWRIHDYLDYNPSRVEVLAARAQRVRAAATGGQRRAKTAERSKNGTFAPGDTPGDPPGERLESRLASRPHPHPLPEDPPISPHKRPRKNPEAQLVIDAWFQAFKGKFGSPPPVNGAKAYRIAQKLLGGRALEEALWLVRDFMGNPPDFYAEKNMFSLEHVLSAAPQLLARRGEQPEPPRAWMSHEPRGR